DVTALLDLVIKEKAQAGDGTNFKPQFSTNTAAALSNPSQGIIKTSKQCRGKCSWMRKTYVIVHGICNVTESSELQNWNTDSTLLECRSSYPRSAARWIHSDFQCSLRTCMEFMQTLITSHHPLLIITPELPGTLHHFLTSLVSLSPLFLFLFPLLSLVSASLPTPLHIYTYFLLWIPQLFFAPLWQQLR
ncbi:hypothetical protein PAXRUDRAFT_176231, partial [Paxillus rubicundulus Ve08.2h10]